VNGQAPAPERITNTPPPKPFGEGVGHACRDLPTIEETPCPDRQWARSDLSGATTVRRSREHEIDVALYSEHPDLCLPSQQEHLASRIAPLQFWIDDNEARLNGGNMRNSDSVHVH
jgi:hypothetical protein